jgi:hypothetical protein
MDHGERLPGLHTDEYGPPDAARAVACRLWHSDLLEMLAARQLTAEA